MVRDYILTKDNEKIFYFKSIIDTNNEYLFFMHGAGVDHLMFKEQYTYFEKKYNIIAWDACFHGESIAYKRDYNIKYYIDDFLSVIRKENIAKCILIGQSMGGNIAQEIMIQYPQYLSKIIIIDSTKNIQKLSQIENFMLKISKPLFKLYSLKNLARASSKACSINKEVQKYIEDCFIRMGKSGFINVFLSLYEFIRDDDSISYPDDILLICGEYDKSGNIKSAMEKWSLNNRYGLFIVKNASHNSNQDNPKYVNNLIEKYIEDKLTTAST